MSARRVKGKTGRPVKVAGEKGTKEKIFEAAIEMFAERGYDGVSIRDIGRAVGISEAAVYRHYPGKEAILDSIFAFVEGRIYPQAPEESYDAIVDAVPFEELLQSIPRYMIADPQLIRITRIMMIEMYRNEKIREYVQRELFQRPVDETEALFRRLMAKGKIRECDPGALAKVFIAYITYWYFETFIFDYGVPLDASHVEKTTRAQIKLFVALTRPEGGVAHE
ncbi:MAG: DNA-binding transcriptional repressor AcrR [Methanocella sp. PtaU1.Bin125]|nr:MAG: DNA-binding transcriptional repressor AcrR [Methanocella sp. PtaU1.Bin125]